MKYSYTKLVLIVGLLSFGGGAWAQQDTLAPAVARTVAAAQQQPQPYEVRLTLHWEKEVTMGNLMLRAPRRPARKEQVIYTKSKQTVCRGVLVRPQMQVLFPASCLEQKGYTLNRAVLDFQTGHTVLVSALSLQVKDEIAQFAMPANGLQNVPGVAVKTVPAGKSLQDAYGPDMTEHLRNFFHQKAVTSCHVRRGVTKRRPTLRIGDAVIYQGNIVALVKQKVDNYGGTLGGVSEDAFAIIR